MSNLYLDKGLSSEREIADHFSVLCNNADQDLCQKKINQQTRDIKILELKKEALEAIKAIHMGYQAPVKAAIGRNRGVAWPSLPLSHFTLTAAQMRQVINNIPRMNIADYDLAKPKRDFSPEQTFGEITAFRVWRINQQTGLLTSSFKTEHQWLPGKVLEAHAKPQPHDSNDWSKVGIHAWKSVFEVAEYAKAFLVRPICRI